MEASLSLGWGEVAYEVDAGPKFTSVLTSPAPASTLRVLAQLAERGGWLLHDLHADAAPDRVNASRFLANPEAFTATQVSTVRFG